MVDALASGAEEGRDKLRKATGSSTYALIRGSPNGVTHIFGCTTYLNKIG